MLLLHLTAGIVHGGVNGEYSELSTDGGDDDERLIY